MVRCASVGLWVLCAILTKKHVFHRFTAKPSVIVYIANVPIFTQNIRIPFYFKKTLLNLVIKK